MLHSMILASVALTDTPTQIIPPNGREIDGAMHWMVQSNYDGTLVLGDTEAMTNTVAASQMSSFMDGFPLTIDCAGPDELWATGANPIVVIGSATS